MPYVKRDGNNQVIALYTEAPSECAEDAELLPAQHDDVLKFLNENTEDKNSLQFLSTSDYELVRVLEDLIELLMDKNLILFTELPAEAQKKLVRRRDARHNLHQIDALMVDENDIL